MKTKYDSFAVGKLAKGCARCARGEKLVLFVTGRCNRDCYYCTISRKRWQTDDAWANERAIKDDKDVVEEAKAMVATGAGITGGEPLLVVDRVVRYIKLLKREFGRQFHIHLYTNGDYATPRNMKKLYEAGLDEIRFHIVNYSDNRDKIAGALEYDWDVGVEVPVFPGAEEQLKELMEWLAATRAKFLNLNELEFSERNTGHFIRRGWAVRKGSFTAVDGSADAALAVLKHCDGRMNVHFCTALLKMKHQYRNRMVRRARTIRKPFEKVDENGFLVKGVVYADDLKATANDITKKHRIGPGMIFINHAKKRIELSASRVGLLKGFRRAVVLETPTADPFDFETWPVSD